MTKIIISPKITDKLRDKHRVTPEEVRQCFGNVTGKFLEDDRENNRTIPPTKWFLSYTDSDRLLKVVFIEKEGKIFLKTAYPPNIDEIHLYKRGTK